MMLLVLFIFDVNLLINIHQPSLDHNWDDSWISCNQFITQTGDVRRIYGCNGR